LSYPDVPNRQTSNLPDKSKQPHFKNEIAKKLIKELAAPKQSKRA